MVPTPNGHSKSCVFDYWAFYNMITEKSQGTFEKVCYMFTNEIKICFSSSYLSKLALKK